MARGRDPNPGAGSIDGQTVKATEIADGRGYGGGKKITGRRRHLLVDILGLLVAVLASAASADDGTIAPEVLGRLTAEHQTRLSDVQATAASLWSRLRMPSGEGGPSSDPP